MRKLLAVLIAALALPAAAETITLAHDADPGTSFTYYVLCTPGAVTNSADNCPGQGTFSTLKATTSDLSSTTVTAVASNSAFNLLTVGDVAEFNVPAFWGSRTRRYLTAKASANSVTVDTAITIPTAGANFQWWDAYSGTAAGDGWFNTMGAISVNALVSISQINATSIDGQLECRHGLGGGMYSPAMIVQGPTNKTATAVYALAWSLSGTGQGPWDQCRVGVKVNTDTGVQKITMTVDIYR